MEFASNELWAGLRGQLFGRFKHRLRKVPGMGSGRGMQQESCLHAEGKGQHTCTQLHTHTHVPFLYFMLHSFNLFYIYSRLSRHFMSSEVGHLNQLQMDSARSVPTLVHLRNGRWMNAKNGLARANAIGIPNSCCRSALPYAAI